MAVLQFFRARFAPVALLLVSAMLLTGCESTGHMGPQEKLLHDLPTHWAQTLSSGKLPDILALYSDKAVIHTVYLDAELNGKDQISKYYQDNHDQLPQITILSVYSKAFGQTGLLAGGLSIVYPGKAPLQARYSLTCSWKNNDWLIDTQHTTQQP